MENLTINTPAKINLGLNVLRKRDDGYHDIETFFYPINLFDTLTFSKSSTFEFSCDVQSLNNEKNLVVKAKNLLEHELNIKVDAKINLVKRIPIGAGLGGGSSDAAATLLGINSLLNLNLENQTMHKIASKVGADVPFFLDPKPCYAEGIGDILTPMECTSKYPILIIYPGIHISTTWSYANVKPSQPLFSLRKLVEDCDIDFLFMENKIKNDFEEVAFREFPIIKAIRDELYKFGAMFSLMSGSGSSVYGIFPTMLKAEYAVENFKDRYFVFLHHE